MKAVKTKSHTTFRASIVEIKSTGPILEAFYAVINVFRFTSLYQRQKNAAVQQVQREV